MTSTDNDLRVLHILAELNPSGAETMLRVAAEPFRVKGVSAEIVSTGTNLGSYAQQLEDAGYGLHHVPFGKSPRFFLKLYRLIRSRSFDVVHLHTERANFWIGLVAVAARPKRVIRTVHNCFQFQGQLRWIRGWQRRALSRLGVTHVAIGTSVNANERQTFGLSTHLIPNWYDDQKFQGVTEEQRLEARQALSINMNKQVIVTVGNCSKIKNHVALIEAIAMLPSSVRPLYLHVGKEELQQHERALVTELGIQDSVRFFGAMDDIRPVLRAADIFVMPSLYEGFSIAALEGLAMGLTALLCDVPGLQDLKSTYPCLTYTDSDALSIKSALLELLNESTTTRRDVAGSYPALSRRFYGVERGVTEYLKLYTASKG